MPMPFLKLGWMALVVTVLRLTLVAGALATQGKPDAKNALPFHPTRLLAKFSQDGEFQAGASALAVQGVTIHKQVALVPGLVVLDISKNREAAAAQTDGEKQPDVLATIKVLRASGLFEYVEPDYLVSASGMPTDQALANGTLWGLHNTGQSGGTPDADIDAPEAWDITTGSTNVIVAVIDTGIRYTHADLASQMWRNPLEIPGNGIDDDRDGYVDNVFGMNAITGSGNPLDDHGHGTHVAGTIGAAANNGSPHVGVAWQVRLMACKFLNDQGSGYTSDAVECINFAVAKGAKILNNSWGGGGYSQALFDAIAAARNAGVLFVAAAGNSGGDTDLTPNYPSCYGLDNIISVAALDRSDHLASFSNYGRSSVDLGAPGVSIFSSVADSDSAFATWNGTSMATPHVSGVAALVAARFPGITLAEMRRRLLNTTVPVPDLAGRSVTGGRVNAYNALTAAPDGLLEVSVAASINPLPAGTNVSLFVTVSDWVPVTNATVSGRIVGGGALTFVNTGVAPDRVRGDEIYSATLPVPLSGSSLSVELVVSAPSKTTTTRTETFPVRVPPPNDNFANRIVLSGAFSTTAGKNVFATKETGEPYHAGNRGGASVWWSWTAPATGPVTVTTDGSSFDTLLAVYTGSTVSSLSLVASDDDSGDGWNSTLSFIAVAGTRYHIAVDGYSGDNGTIMLTLFSPPANDAFANRTSIPGVGGMFVGHNLGATKETSEPAHAGNAGGKSVWWIWRAPRTGSVTVTTHGSSFDTVLAIYTGSSVCELIEVASNDDCGTGLLTSAVSFTAVAGTTYQMAVDGYDGAAGVVHLNLTPSSLLCVSGLERLPDGTFRIWIANADGTPLSGAQMPAIDVYASTNIAQSRTAWTRLAGTPIAASGRLYFDDPAARSLPKRFYRVQVQP